MTTGLPLEKCWSICSSAGSRADSRCSWPRGCPAHIPGPGQPSPRRAVADPSARVTPAGHWGQERIAPCLPPVAHSSRPPVTPQPWHAGVGRQVQLAAVLPGTSVDHAGLLTQGKNLSRGSSCQGRGHRILTASRLVGSIAATEWTPILRRTYIPVAPRRAQFSVTSRLLTFAAQCGTVRIDRGGATPAARHLTGCGRAALRLPASR